MDAMFFSMADCNPKSPISRLSRLRCSVANADSNCVTAEGQGMAFPEHGHRASVKITRYCSRINPIRSACVDRLFSSLVGALIAGVMMSELLPQLTHENRFQDDFFCVGSAIVLYIGSLLWGE